MMKKKILHKEARLYLNRGKYIAYILSALIIIILMLLPSSVGCQPTLTRISPDLIPYNYRENLTIEGLNFNENSRVVLIGSAPKTIKQKPAIAPNKEKANITAIHIKDKYAYVIEDSTSLHILDIEKPDDPILIGTLTDESFKELVQVWAEGEFLYLIDSGSGIWIIDISDPNDPQMKKEVYFKDIFPVKIFVKQNFIYSVFCKEELPDDPNTPSSYIFIFERYEGIFDLSVSSVTKIPGNAYDICVKEYEVCNTGEKCEAAYVATGEKVGIYDVTDPVNPSKISQIDPNGSSNIQRILIRGDTLYMGDRYYGIHIADISNITVPRIVSSLGLQGTIKDICPCGPYVIVANGSNGLQIIDLQERENPSIFSNIYTFGDADAICSYGYYIYVANGNDGLGIVEAPSLVHSNLLAYKNTKDNIWAITSQNGYAYVSNGESGMKVFKTNPSWDPDPVSEILNDPNDKPNKDHLFTYTFVNGNMIYLADKTEFETWEWDPDNISPPKFRGFTKLQDTIMSIFVQGNFAYIANFSFGAQSLNITNPDKISQGGYIFSEGFAYDIIVDNDKIAYLANDWKGLWIVDFRDPYQPVEKSKLFQYKDEYAHGLKKYNDHIYIANGSNGIEIINVNDPNTPYHIDTINYTEFLKEQGIEAPFNDFLNEIDIEYPFLYTAGDYQGIWINYISYIPGFPPKVTPIDFISLPYGASAVKSDGERLYLSDDFKNFYVFYPPMYSPKHILVDSTQSTANKITFKFTPQDLPVGSYDIFVISDSGAGRLEKALNIYRNKVTFHPGLNILSYPGPIPLENAQAFYLLKNLSLQEEGSDLKIKNIWTKKKGSVSESFQVAYINQENKPAGDNFDIMPLGGYLLYFQGIQKKDYFLPSNLINMTNTELLRRLKSEFVQGQNTISIPLTNDITIKSSDLISPQSQPEVISVQEWNITQGKWQAGYSFFNTINGNVKNLSGGHGYMVSVP